MSFKPSCYPVRSPAPTSAIEVLVDKRPVVARDGDTILTLLLREGGAVRKAEFGTGSRLRAGFCAMGACQDCWVNLADGQRVQACSTLIEKGMEVVTGLEYDKQ